MQTWLLWSLCASLLAIGAPADAQEAASCCPEGAILRAGGYCGNSGKRVNFNCPNGHMLLRDIVLKNGSLSTRDTPSFVFTSNPHDYCVSKMVVNSTIDNHTFIPVAVVCYQALKDVSGSTIIHITGVLTLLSAAFLVATLAVYAYLPELRDLQGRCYASLCLSMALAFLTLGLLQLNPSLQGSLCATSGFLVYFWMIATFFWMNVICLNVYRTVRDPAGARRFEQRQYAIYGCYAWGCALAFLAVALIANYVEGTHWRPGFDNNSCWFSGRTETWIFFYGPVAMLVSANVMLFIAASLQLWRRTINLDSRKHGALRHRFLLSLKLFLVMGVTWIFEIASFAHNDNNIFWDIMDVFNCLQGVVIFVLLVVLRRRCVSALAQRGFCGPCCGQLAGRLSQHDAGLDSILQDDDNHDGLHVNSVGA